jgi:hypothetical protein
MSQAATFFPSRRKGLIFHIACLLAFAGLSVLAVFLSFQEQNKAYFVLLLLAAVILFAPLPLLGYQAYALIKAHYQFDRDGIHLRWGIRAEDIPLENVEWVRPANDLATSIPSPWPGLPGAIHGTVQVDGLGPIEFMASEREQLMLIATPQKIFAISPENPAEFLQAFQSALEMGSLQRIPAQSILPAAYLAQVWADLPARWMLIGSILLALILFVSVSLAVPGRDLVALGFYPDGRPLPPSPSAQILLLPLLGLLFFFIDLIAGLFFYRQPAYRALGYLLWASSSITSLLLVGAVLWILMG